MNAVCAFAVYNLHPQPLERLVKRRLLNSLEQVDSSAFERMEKENEGESGREEVRRVKESLLNINNKCEWSFIQFSRVKIHLRCVVSIEFMNRRLGKECSNEFVLWLSSGGVKSKDEMNDGEKSFQIFILKQGFFSLLNNFTFFLQHPSKRFLLKSEGLKTMIAVRLSNRAPAAASSLFA